MNPVNLKYSKEHEWAKVEGKVVTLGISDHAQESLGDVVFVELPEVGDKITAGKPYGTVESVKAVSDLYASVDGTVIAINDAVIDAPDTLNTDPYEEGWLIKVEADDLAPLDNLMDAGQYEAFLAEEAH